MTLRSLTEKLLEQEKKIQEGGNPERQRRLSRLTARERIEKLVDGDFFELGIWQAWGMYCEWGDIHAAGLIVGIGKVSKRTCMIIANDATVKAGALFPQSVKKMIRAQKIAAQVRLPLLYLVDSSGVFLPLQDEIFPDEDDFGRIFRNNSLLSAAGIPQFAAIMGNCIAGGGYLPVLCDQLIMTEGSGLYLAGPALVKAAIGQEVDSEELGGASMHAQLSGTVDYREPNDDACIKRLRRLVAQLPNKEEEREFKPPSSSCEKVYEIVSGDNKEPYEIRDVIDCLIDADTFDEYKAEYGKTLVTGWARIAGRRIGIVANQRRPIHAGTGEVEMGSVIYSDSADKASRFVMECNQLRLPILFLQDVVGFMVGKAAEESGIIRSGAKLVNAISNSVVPKITIVIGNSFGAGNYALCGKAYDPTFIFAWPNSRYAVMGAQQAADTLAHIRKEKDEAFHQEIFEKYQEQMDIRYGAARGWVDAIIAPHQTRAILEKLLPLLKVPSADEKPYVTGVLQV